MQNDPKTRQALFKRKKASPLKKRVSLTNPPKKLQINQAALIF
jgi:hypothetical protein